MSDSENVHGLGGTLFWGLLVAALAVAGTVFYFMSDRGLAPARGFGGANSDRGFPNQVGTFSLNGVKEVSATAAEDRHLLATYSQAGGPPLSFKYYGFTTMEAASDWMRQLSGELTKSTYREERRGPVEEKDMEADGHPMQKFGEYVFIKGTEPGQPALIIWTQDTSGFVISAPTLALAAELRGYFKAAHPSPTP